jgi:membrane protease YdiL (CAAX protease family)
MVAIARLFYDGQARRLGPLLRGHFLLFDRREAPAYSPATGLRLLVIFAVLELVVGPRAHLLSWFGVTPERWLRLPLLLLLSVVAARLWAQASFSDIGFLPWRQWTATEKLYFPQGVLLANAIFFMVFSRQLQPLQAHSELWAAAAGIAVLELLWGFYQEVNYRGILQTELTRRLGNLRGPLLANLAYTFGPLHFYHLMSSRSPASVAMVLAATFTIGLVFTFIFHRTRNLWLVGILHGIGNAYINGASEIASLLS